MHVRSVLSMLLAVFLLQLSACNNGGGGDGAAGTSTIAVTDSVAPVTDLQVPFGSATVNTTADQTVTVTNSGSANLVIGAIASVNPLAAPFSIMADTCSNQSILPAASCTLTVRFAPTISGSFSDSFDIPSNDPNTVSTSVSVSGTGADLPVPNIAVTDSVAPIADLQVPFSSATVSTTIDQTVTVTNSGTANLVIGAIASANPLAAPFSIIADACSSTTLAPAAVCAISLRFAPLGTGGFNDSFNIPSNDPDTASTTVSVSGTGTAVPVPNIEVTDATGSPNDLIVSFGSITVASIADETVTVTNTGTASLVLGTVASVNPLAAPYTNTADTCSGQSIAPSGTCTITLHFAPALARTFNDSFDIPSNDPDTATITVSLSGKGLPKAPPITTAMKVSGTTPLDYGYFHSPTIAYNIAGDRGVAVWEAYNGNEYRLFYSYFNGTVWSTEAVLADKASAPDVASDGTNFMVVYYTTDSGDVSARLFTAATATWGASVALESSTNGIGSMPKVVSRGPGVYAAVWTQDDGSGYPGVYVNMYGVNTEAGWDAAPVLIESIPDNALAATIASNGSGFAVAWLQFEGGVYNVYANIFSGTTWTIATALETGSGSVGSISLASNGSGYAAAWSQINASVPRIFTNIYSSGSWTNAAIIDDGPRTATSPKIASNGSGYAVAWEQWDFGSVNKTYANVYSGSAWTSAERIDSGADYAGTSAIGSNGSGYAVVWRQFNGSNYDLYSNILAGGAWGGAEAVETGAGDVIMPGLARKGVAYGAIWVQPDATSNRNVFTNAYGGSNWGTETGLVQNAHTGSSNLPRMSTNDSGATLAVWQQYENGSMVIYGSLNSADTGSWSTPFPFSQKTSYSYSPDVASDGQDFMIVYRQDGALYSRTCSSIGSLGLETLIRSSGMSPGSPVIASNGAGYAATWQDGYDIAANIYSSGAWTTATVIETGSGNAQNPQIASNGSGYAVAWQQYDSAGYGGYISIFAGVYENGQWSLPALLEQGTGHGFAPRIASNRTGYAVTWWQPEGPGFGGSYVAVMANILTGTNWQTDATIIGSNNSDIGYPDIASNGTGYMITWHQYDVTGYNIWVREYNGASWATSVGDIDAEPVYEALTPKIASDGSTYAIIWQQSDGAVNNIYSKKYDGIDWANTSAIKLNGVAQNISDHRIISNGAGYSAIWSQIGQNDALIKLIRAKLAF